MKKAFFFLLIYITNIQLVAAEGNSGILGDFDGPETAKSIRNGDIHASDIPEIIKGAIDFFMGLAGTIAVIFVIVGAYKILFGSLEQDKTKGKDTIFMALGGFALAALSWFIVKLIIDNFS